MKKIFIVEDDEDIRELIEFLLDSEFYNVQSFSTAEAFKKQIGQQKPDLILLDIMLPDGNGLEICRTLSTHHGTSKIPVFLMSAHADVNLIKDHCATGFIAKPFDVDDFLAIIQKQIN